MPNRMLYASLIGSRKINQLKPLEFELYIRLVLTVDDYGRYLGSAVRVSRACWPDREDMTSRIVEPLLERLHGVGLIQLYDDGGERYLQMTNWNQRTRAEASRFPQPPDECQTNDRHMTVIGRSSAHVDVDVDVDVDDRRRRVDDTQPTVKYGSQKNVKLTDQELTRLKEEYPDMIDDAIELLSLWLADKGDKSRAKTHNATIRRWVIDAVKERRQKGQPKRKPANIGNFTGREYTAEQLDALYEPIEVTR